MVIVEFGIQWGSKEEMSRILGCKDKARTTKKMKVKKNKNKIINE
jgi:hypothetical protein